MSVPTEKYNDKMVAEKGFALEPVATTETSGATGEVYNQDKSLGDLHRSFTPRQIHVGCGPQSQDDFTDCTDHLTRFKRGERPLHCDW